MIHYAGGRSDRQIWSGWSRVSLSVVLVSRVITLGTPGGQRLLLCLAFSRFRHLSDFPIRASSRSSKGNCRSSVGKGRGGDRRGFKGHPLLEKKIGFMLIRITTPVDREQEVMECGSCMNVWLITTSFTFTFAISKPQGWLSISECHHHNCLFKWWTNNYLWILLKLTNPQDSCSP